MVSLAVIRDVSSLCEYMFRLGALDSAKLCDPSESTAFAETEDGYQILSFLSDGRKLDYMVYIDKLIMLSHSGPRLSNFVKFMRTYGMDIAIKKGICHICDYYYRKGVKYGARMSSATAHSFINEIGKGRDHKRADGSRSLSHIAFMECMKSECNDIGFAQESAGFKNMMRPLSIQIAKAIREDRTKKQKMQFNNKKKAVND